MAHTSIKFRLVLRKHNAVLVFLKPLRCLNTKLLSPYHSTETCIRLSILQIFQTLMFSGAQNSISDPRMDACIYIKQVMLYCAENTWKKLKLRYYFEKHSHTFFSFLFFPFYFPVFFWGARNSDYKRECFTLGYLLRNVKLPMLTLYKIIF